MTAFDAARAILTNAVQAMHPDARVVCGRAPQVLPGRISRDARSLLLRMRLNCCNVAALLHRHGRRASPTCAADCPDPETLEHLHWSCPQRSAYQRLGLPTARCEDLLFPVGPAGTRRDAFSHLLEYLKTTHLVHRL